MAKYQNKDETKKIGEQILKLRVENGFNIEDISFMTGFARTTISSIEMGSNTDASHLIEIAKAIGVHPRELFNVPFKIKPRYKLPTNRINKSSLTERIKKLLSESDFFKTPKLVNEVVKYLSDKNNLKLKAINSVTVSVILKRFCDAGELKYIKKGRKNLYSKR